jgi:hypothetical protein
MNDRSGEKIGWTLGWSGAFLWVCIMAVVLVFLGKTVPAAVGFTLFGVAGLLVRLCAPWRHPEEPYWKLMMPLYAILVVSIAWVLWAYNGYKALGLDWWSLLMLFFLFFPLVSSGRSKWIDRDAPEEASTDDRQET